MFSKCIVLVVMCVGFAVYASVSGPTKPFVLENFKRLESLVKRKKAANISQDITTVLDDFDEFANSTERLLNELDKYSTNEPEQKKQVTIEMISYNIAAMEALLAQMCKSKEAKSGQMERLHGYREKPWSDTSKSAQCNRPAKKVHQPERKEYEKEDNKSVMPQKKMDDDETNFLGNN